MSATTDMTIRVVAFAGVLAAMWIWEWLLPKRKQTCRQPQRWLSNLGLVAINSVLARLAVPLSAVAAAELAARQGWGVLVWLNGPAWLEFIIGLVLLDLALYLQHVMFHAVPALWRLHMVHHADLDFDATTGLRFHTLEIVLSLGLKCGVVLALGPSPWTVLVFEVLLNATSIFNHSNVRMPAWLDRLLRLVVVTPDMHRVHHSALSRETNSNFGFNLPWWDRWLGTYRAQPEIGHEQMTIGLAHLRDERRTERLHWMLVLPFLHGPGAYPIVGGDKRKAD
ncbi:MAG: sterol desaturase family protein [Planctomycetaceae bacterium]|nr:sterol desaturase family protein [Planctomycetaceae bacterium]